MIEIATVPGGQVVNLGTLTSLDMATITMTLLQEADPGAAPLDIATVHLSDDVNETPGIYLTPGAPRMQLTAAPSSLWVFTHSEGDFVQVVFEGTLPTGG